MLGQVETGSTKVELKLNNVKSKNHQVELSCSNHIS